jgi:osmotically inducible protein OsmC
MASGATKRATTTWQGDLATGSGTFVGQSGVLPTLPVSWASRTGDANGRTSPEELLAAAHSSCYAMAFSYDLGNAGHAPQRLEVTADVTFAPKAGGGFEVKSSHLTVNGTVEGIDQATFTSLAEEASRNCPISAAISNVEITVEATLS